jgi:ADP-heptose:LPS heptosyltransferase
MSLPLAFRTTVRSIPAGGPYLSADPQRVERWASRLRGPEFKIGVAWLGSAAGTRVGRSAPLAQFRRLAETPGVRLISLQKAEAAGSRAELPEGVKVEFLGDDFDTGGDAFLDTAAVMKVLDLVISVDTAVAHLAGALGVPTWAALKSVPHWFWLLERSDSPWYPTMRLFRQKTAGDWQGVFAEIESALADFIAKTK